MLFVAIDITPTMLKLGAVGGIGIILSIIIHSLNFSTTVTLWVSLITFFLFSVIVYFVQKRSALKRINTEVKSHSLYISLLFLVALFSVNILQIGYNNLQPYQQNRISSFLHPEKDPNASWNLEQSKIACGSGRITGKGFLNGTQTNYRFLPFSFTDFAYCSYAEQFGLIGNVILLTLYGTLVITILNWTDRVKDKFGKFLLYGAVIMLFLNIVQHIGMNIGLLPITGVPLPLISYGGSAIIVSFIALGIAMSVHNSDEMERTKIEKVRG
ncbi:MAG: hypothetical protein Kow0081_3480 [Candidatus Dojkabacteria bacterium]